MCGLIGKFHSSPEEIATLVDKLQYRGRDSKGLCGWDYDKPFSYKTLDKEWDWGIISQCRFYGKSLLAHTRWGSSGVSSLANTHPILSFDNSLFLCHNGNIENYKEIAKDLSESNIYSKGETDTEVVTNWIAVNQIWSIDDCTGMEWLATRFNDTFQGTWAILFVEKDLENKIFFLVKDSPLYYYDGTLCSDNEVLPGFIKIPNNSWGFVEWVPANDKYELVVNGQVIDPTYELSPISSCKDFTTIHSIKPGLNLSDFGDIMLSEIHEQAYIAYNYDSWGKQFLETWNQNEYESVKLIGTGSSFNAALFSKWFFELNNIPCTVDYASEYNYFQSSNPTELKICLSQSGETADVKDVMQTLHKLNNRTLLVTNKKLSSCGEYSSKDILLEITKEKAVAATKTFTSSVLCLLSCANYIGGNFNSDFIEVFKNSVLQILKKCDRIQEVASQISHYQNIMVLGSGKYGAIAAEGALKFKEIANIFTESMFLEVLKHGPISLVGKNLLCICLLPSKTHDRYNRLSNNIEQIKARDGNILVIAEDAINNNLYLPVPKSGIISPLVSVVVLQLLSYYIGKHRGLLVDTPKACAKAVTVY